MAVTRGTTKFPSQFGSLQDRDNAEARPLDGVPDRGGQCWFVSVFDCGWHYNHHVIVGGWVRVEDTISVLTHKI